jgi:hypothetical protein
VRRNGFPRASSVDVSAIGRLLVIRTKRFEFGKDDFGWALAIDFNGGSFRVGDSSRRGGPTYFLSVQQAAVVALGSYAIADVPRTSELPVPGFRYPATDEPWVAVTPRKPVQSEMGPARRKRRAT